MELLKNVIILSEMNEKALNEFKEIAKRLNIEETNCAREAMKIIELYKVILNFQKEKVALRKTKTWKEN